jgi:hypothetical protein
MSIPSSTQHKNSRKIKKRGNFLSFSLFIFIISTPQFSPTHFFHAFPPPPLKKNFLSLASTFLSFFTPRARVNERPKGTKNSFHSFMDFFLCASLLLVRFHCALSEAPKEKKEKKLHSTCLFFFHLKTVE